MHTAYIHGPAPTWVGGLAADDDGQNDHRPALVLLHGMTFDRSIWRPIVAELERIDPGRRVLAIDLPGHGQSPAQPSYELDDVPDQLNRAVQQAGLVAPVVVGHSAGGLAATMYAARHPARGVINIDQPLDVAPFAEFVRSLAGRLRGPDFPAVWQMFYASFHTELLPADAQNLVRSTCQPRQQVVLGYWQHRPDTERDSGPTDCWRAVRAYRRRRACARLPAVARRTTASSRDRGLATHRALPAPRPAPAVRPAAGRHGPLGDAITRRQQADVSWPAHACSAWSRNPRIGQVIGIAS